MMNILFISPNSPENSIGGVERYITNLIQYSRLQVDSTVHILLPTTDGSYTSRNENVNLYYEESLFVAKEIRDQKKIQLKARLFAQFIENIITSKNIDIICAENIHIGLPAGYSILLNMIASKFSVPVILRLHSFSANELQRELVNQLMWQKISCVSKSVTGDCFQKGADINILSTDYLGVDTNEFNDKPAVIDIKKQLGLNRENKIILIAGRIVLGRKNIINEKGFINLIKAFSKLSPRFSQYKLLIAVGKAPEILSHEFNESLQMLLGYIKLNHVEDNTIVKQFELHEMADVYKGSDVFVLPSENETFGQVFIESMACGLPVIGTKVGGIPEIISDSYNGFLVNPDDPSNLSQKIEQVLHNDTLRKSFIDAGKKVVNEKFTADKQFSSFFNKLDIIVNN